MDAIPLPKMIREGLGAIRDGIVKAATSLWHWFFKNAEITIELPGMRVGKIYAPHNLSDPVNHPAGLLDDRECPPTDQSLSNTKLFFVIQFITGIKIFYFPLLFHFAGHNLSTTSCIITP